MTYSAIMLNRLASAILVKLAAVSYENYCVNQCVYVLIPLQLLFMHKDSTYRINVYTFNKTLEFSDRIKKIDVSI